MGDASASPRATLRSWPPGLLSSLAERPPPEELPVLDTELTLKTFDEAMAYAFYFAETHPHAHASIVVDADGTVLDLTVHTADDATVASAIVWASGVIVAMEKAAAVVLISVGPEPVTELAEDDIALFNECRGRFAHRGIALLDWIKSDPDNFRSLAFSCDVDHAWDVPPAA
jgi:hypothetical protein